MFETFVMLNAARKSLNNEIEGPIGWVSSSYLLWDKEEVSRSHRKWQFTRFIGV